MVLLMILSSITQSNKLHGFITAWLIYSHVLYIIANFSEIEMSLVIYNLTYLIHTFLCFICSTISLTESLVLWRALY